LDANSSFVLYLAPAAAIPRLLKEIGRCREVTFRAAGEGTGHATDLDPFDSYYQHLFLWSKMYRLAVTTDVLSKFGIGGLYTSTLFRFHSRFFERIGPAVELGRSFVAPEYQKNYAPLLLLWKGITRVVQRRPEAPVLFGAVSISNQYRPASRGLMANYLSGRASHELARFVQPRRRFRQYLKAGGRVLGFNLDADFSDVLDALIVADLRTAPIALLERCMGRAGAKAFLDPQRTGSINSECGLHALENDREISARSALTTKGNALVTNPSDFRNVNEVYADFKVQ
jgi:hypothetical protein